MENQLVRFSGERRIITLEHERERERERERLTTNSFLELSY